MLFLSKLHKQGQNQGFLESIPGYDVKSRNPVSKKLTTESISLFYEELCGIPQT